ncbi:MAG TPA: hypothetical protein VG318_18175 [Actinomycetota bacterium]|nr:hypothetical protein [Actinomycetota bacterium]
MADSERLQEALAAHLEHLEMGGPEPDVSHLTANERRELQELIDALDLTEGIAFGSGREEGTAALEAATEAGERLLADLRTSLPPGVRLEADGNWLIAHVGGVAIEERFLVGTFGGRVRVWLLDLDSVAAIEENAEALADLGRVFRMFPDMSAVALVGRDLSCAIVEPEDTAPRIQVPSGSLASRRYKRAVEPAAGAVPAFLDELIPYWDPMPAFDPESGVRIDIAEVATGCADAAIESQRKIGERARKGNPKKDALSAFGAKETKAIDALLKGLFDGSIDPSDVEDRIERVTER